MCPAITTNNRKNGPFLIVAGNLSISAFESANRVYSTNGICPTITTKHNNNIVKIIEEYE